VRRYAARRSDHVNEGGHAGPPLPRRRQHANLHRFVEWTQQGIGKVNASAKRLDAGRKAFKKAGAEIKDTYMTLGRYDLVCVIEAPDDETYARQCWPRFTRDVSSETLKAFSEDQYRKITGSI